jgi:hypothetical protein
MLFAAEIGASLVLRVTVVVDVKVRPILANDCGRTLEPFAIAVKVIAWTQPRNIGRNRCLRAEDLRIGVNASEQEASCKEELPTASARACGGPARFKPSLKRR